MLASYLRGGPVDHAPNAQSLSRLEAWLDGLAPAQRSVNPACAKVVFLHRKVLELGDELLTLDATLPRVNALGRLKELYALRDELLAGLRHLASAL
jgi:hypothetical protein